MKEDPPITIVNFGKIRASKSYAKTLKQLIQLLFFLFIIFSIIAGIGTIQVTLCQDKHPSMTALQCIRNEYNHSTKNFRPAHRR
jgi:hypothetical protein